MEKKKKVLILIDWFLPGTNSGGPVRSYVNMIEHMHDVDFLVITRDIDYCSSKKYQNIDIGKWNRLMPNLRVSYLDDEKLSFAILKDAIAGVEFDTVLINGMYSFYFSILPLLLLRKSKKRIVVSARGMLNPQAFSVKPIRKAIYLKLSRLMGNYNDIIFHATNIEEANNIKKYIGDQTRVLIAPNFPRKANDNDTLMLDKYAGELRIVNVARVAEEKGTLRMLSYIKSIEQGNVHLDIYGPIYDQDYWDKCMQQIKLMPSNVRVVYKGIAKSDDIPDILSKYHTFVMLSEGENFGHSILEAMSCGLPVIISDQTPWTEINEKGIGWALQLEGKDSFLDAVNQMIYMEDQEFKEKANANKQYAMRIINDISTYNLNEILLNV